ncbi:hypothetical protein HDV01_005727 [Terramyces sp. JEL0728]|nr:hypothetical protein HDV01_005727 [Terramyces sp. JEL0728]
MSNSLSGPIPDLSALTSMNYLFLGYNNFKMDAFPKWIFSMKSLYDLTMDGTPMPGTIFPEITRLTNLEFLSLSNCNISGPVTSEIQSLHNLQSLYLDHNHLSGPIPPEISYISTLVNLDLSYNSFTGDVPSQITLMSTYRPTTFFFNNQSPNESSDSSSSGVSSYIFYVVGAVIVLGIIGAILYLNNARKQKRFPAYGQQFQQPQNFQPAPQPVYQQPAPYQTAPNPVASKLAYQQAYQQPLQQAYQTLQPVYQPPAQNTQFQQPVQNNQTLQNQPVYQGYGAQNTSQPYLQSSTVPSLSHVQTVTSHTGISPNATQDSPKLGVYNSSPNRQSFQPSPQTLVGNDSPHESHNSNSRYSQILPYQQTQPVETEQGQLPIISPPRSPYADLLNRQETTQPPVLEFNPQPITLNVQTAKIEPEVQPPIISKPF